jgi:hypothetical protein
MKKYVPSTVLGLTLWAGCGRESAVDNQRIEFDSAMKCMPRFNLDDRYLVVFGNGLDKAPSPPDTYDSSITSLKEQLGEASNINLRNSLSFVVSVAEYCEDVGIGYRILGVAENMGNVEGALYGRDFLPTDIVHVGNRAEKIEKSDIEKIVNAYGVAGAVNVKNHLIGNRTLELIYGDKK